MKKVIIIAEAGVNHNGNIEKAKEMINVAADAKVDYVKFQTFIPEKLVSKFADKANYQKSNTDSDGKQLKMLEELSLDFADFVELKDYCKQRGVGFLSTPFDLESIEFLDNLGVDFWKIPSGEITNYPYLVKIGNTGREVVLSTGMSTIQEVNDAIRVLRDNGCPKIKLLHCNTQYPTPYEMVNLKAMDTMFNVTGLEIGYSDHTLGIEVPIAAVAMGATIIEKHFTLDRNLYGPDHKASLEPDELKSMVESIRNIEKAIGNGKKEPTESEYENVRVARKSIVAKRMIKKGEILSEENVTTKRPGNGISPMKWNEVVSTVAVRDFHKDELIEI